MKRILIVTSAFLALAATAAVVRAGDAPAAAGQTGDGITVQGSGSVATIPDRARLSFGVETQAPTAKAALAANAAEMRRVIAAVKAAGATDVRTEQISLQPRYAEGGTITGYAAVNTVTATVRDLGRAGAVVDGAVDAGANQVHGPSLSRGDQAELYRAALKAAVADARARAQTLAAAAGVTLGRVVTVVEGGGHGPVPVAYDRAEAGGSTPVEPGTQEVGATVTVTFAVS